MKGTTMETGWVLFRTSVQRGINGHLLHRSFGQAYGYAASKLLVMQNPSKARTSRNPENYKYFAEVEYYYVRKRGIWPFT